MATPLLQRTFSPSSDTSARPTAAAPPWRGFVVERYQLESNEVRDRTLDFYSVDVNLSRSFQLEWLCNGSFRQTLMVPDALCILPAQQPLTMRWRDPLQVLSVKLEPSLLLSTARLCL